MKNLITISLILIAIVLATGCNRPKTDKTNAITPEEEVVYIPKTEYGIIVDSLQVFSGTVKKNQNLAELLLPYNISYNKIDGIARKSKDSFDVRKIRSGANYAILYTSDSVATAQYFIYENNAINYTVYDIRDSINIYSGIQPTDTVIAHVSGVIESSLWNAMVVNQASPILAIELSEIYAWTIDFFGIQRGDRFNVVFEKIYKKDEYIGLGRVLTAEIHHMGNDFKCYRFESNGDDDFYDEDGGSMRRTFLKAPLRYSRVSSGFSYARKHPVLKITRPHLGIDYAAPEGTPVYSIGDGIVTAKGFQKRGGGNYIKIKHNGTYTTEYMHLKGYAKGMKTGIKVKQGQLIGYVGQTGLATGPHLDFRVFRNGQAMNPNNLKAPPAKPVDSAYLESFMESKKQLDQLMLQYSQEQILLLNSTSENTDILK